MHLHFYLTNLQVLTAAVNMGTFKIWISNVLFGSILGHTRLWKLYIPDYHNFEAVLEQFLQCLEWNINLNSSVHVNYRSSQLIPLFQVEVHNFPTDECLKIKNDNQIDRPLSIRNRWTVCWQSYALNRISLQTQKYKKTKVCIQIRSQAFLQ